MANLRFPLFFLCLLLLFSVVAPFLTPYSPYDLHLESKNLAPCAKFWFGTDELGRDLFARIALGLRISLFIAFFAALIDLCIGVLWGSLAAFAGGFIEEMMIRVCDILQAIPNLLIVILLTVMWGSGLLTVLIAIGCTGWLHTARIVRGQLVQIRTLDYIRGAKAIGAPPFYLIRHYFLPNAIGPIIASLTLALPSAIFSEAFLSFLGLGIQAPEASLGVMVGDGLSAIRYYPWRLWIPALTLSSLLLTFHALGHAMRDHLDPRIKQ